jgi:hypothetical protein
MFSVDVVVMNVEPQRVDAKADSYSEGSGGH